MSGTRGKYATQNDREQSGYNKRPRPPAARPRLPARLILPMDHRRMPDRESDRA